VTVSLVNPVMSVPAAYRLYLPEAWAKDRRRCRAVGVPPAVRLQTKWELALAAIDGLLADDLPRAPVVADAGYGVITEFRETLVAHPSIDWTKRPATRSPWRHKALGDEPPARLREEERVAEFHGLGSVASGSPGTP